MGDVQVAHKASARLVTKRKEPWEGESGSRPFSPSRLPFPANFYRERETVYVRGTEFTLPNFSEV